MLFCGVFLLAGHTYSGISGATLVRPTDLTRLAPITVLKNDSMLFRLIIEDVEVCRTPSERTNWSEALGAATTTGHQSACWSGRILASISPGSTTRGLFLDAAFLFSFFFFKLCALLLPFPRKTGPDSCIGSRTKGPLVYSRLGGCEAGFKGTKSVRPTTGGKVVDVVCCARLVQVLPEAGLSTVNKRSCNFAAQSEITITMN
jgi:hypothetical protein